MLTVGTKEKQICSNYHNFKIFAYKIFNLFGTTLYIGLVRHNSNLFFLS